MTLHVKGIVAALFAVIVLAAGGVAASVAATQGASGPLQTTGTETTTTTETTETTTTTDGGDGDGDGGGDGGLPPAGPGGGVSGEPDFTG